MQYNFLRLTRNAHTPQQYDAIAHALSVTPGDTLNVVSVDAGAYGDDVTVHIRRRVAELAEVHGVDAWHGVEVIGPGWVLDGLGDLGAPRYRAVMARGEDGRVIVACDADGLPLHTADGRDVLVVARYERV